MWGFPGSGIKLESTVLVGGFLTPEPPGKPNYKIKRDLKGKECFEVLAVIYCNSRNQILKCIKQKKKKYFYKVFKN